VASPAIAAGLSLGAGFIAAQEPDVAEAYRLLAKHLGK
jgi:hypothetical protein